MAKKSKELIQLLFPEYQIKACVDERGFIAKNQQSTNYAQKSTQTINRGNIQQQNAPASTPLQRGAGTNTATATPVMLPTPTLDAKDTISAENCEISPFVSPFFEK